MSLVDKCGMKQELVGALVTKLQGELETMRRAARDAREAATHEEAKPENDKDTRALEASYLAGGQAARVRDLEAAIKVVAGMKLLELDPGKSIVLSAVVTLEDENKVRATFFVAPFGGGTMLKAALGASSTSVQVVTPPSPLGRALLGRTEGEVIEVRGVGLRASPQGAAREMTIVDVW
jgi:transcription elongation GreA/GreB family factor